MILGATTARALWHKDKLQEVIVIAEHVENRAAHPPVERVRSLQGVNQQFAVLAALMENPLPYRHANNYMYWAGNVQHFFLLPNSDHSILDWRSFLYILMPRLVNSIH